MLSWIVTVLLVALFTVLFGFLAIGPAAILAAVALGRDYGVVPLRR